MTDAVDRLVRMAAPTGPVLALAIACAPPDTHSGPPPEHPDDPAPKAAPAATGPREWDAGLETDAAPEPPGDAERPWNPEPVHLEAADPSSALALVATVEGALLFSARTDALGLVEIVARPIGPDARPSGDVLPVARIDDPVLALTAARHWRAGRILLAVTTPDRQALTQVDELGRLVTAVRGQAIDGTPAAPPGLARLPQGFAVASTRAADPDAVHVDRHALAPDRPVNSMALACRDAAVLDLAFTGEDLWLAARCGGLPWLIGPERGAVRALTADAAGHRLLADGRGLIEVVRRGKSGEGARLEARRLGAGAETDGPYHLLAKVGPVAEVITALRPSGGLALVLGSAGDGPARLLRVDATLEPEGYGFGLPEGFVPGAAVWRRESGLVCGHWRQPDGAGEPETLTCLPVPP
jgi:hypothetical protein